MRYINLRVTYFTYIILDAFVQVSFQYMKVILKREINRNA